jgi:glutamyl-tRNA synthetase
MQVVTRFAPSPTGELHIGSARTALFNFLYSRHTGGKFLLRIEDTDKERSTQESFNAIIEGLAWLGIDHDDEIVIQSQRVDRHKEIAEKMVELGKAYYCLTPQSEVQAQREQHQALGKFVFESEWRDKNLCKEDIPADAQAVIRLKAPREGETTIHDLVQGDVTVRNDTLDDMVMLRSDGTPTYMLAVVVDDYDMGVTHVIRGDDHLNNAFRQLQIYKAMQWPIPEYAHIPLIHGPDGAKLSKRHGAVGVKTYEEMGYLPEAINNYLLRLGWGHGNDEIISREQAIEWFDVRKVQKAAARLDFSKMLHLNAHYIKHANDEDLIPKVLAMMEGPEEHVVSKVVHYLKHRVKTIVELADLARLFTSKPVMTPEATDALSKSNMSLLQGFARSLAEVDDWSEVGLKQNLDLFLQNTNTKMGEIGPALRAALTGTLQAPSVVEILLVMGREEARARLSLASR